MIRPVGLVRVLVAISAISAILPILLILRTQSFLTIPQNIRDEITARQVLSLLPLSPDWKRTALMFKIENSNPRFLTIGIPTVRRQQSNYFLETLDSLLNCTYQENIPNIYIVIFLADFNATWKYEMANIIEQKYSKIVRDGTLQIIEAPTEFYPSLDHLNHTYNDPIAKRKWRSKQNVDYAFLWLYSKELSKYYMQMEDDIFTVPGYLNIIKEFIEEQKTDWTCLEFSELGFIGKLYHSKYLEKLAKTVLLFYEEQPVDYTFLYFNILNLQGSRIIRRPTLFQHVGFHSSLPGKIQPLKDKYFDNIKKTLHGDNPPAKVHTTLLTSPDFLPDLAYSKDDGYFWAQAAPVVDDTIHVLFDEPQSLEKVVILSGSQQHPTDKIENGRLDACLSVKISGDNRIECFNNIFLGYSENGTFLADNLEKQLNKFMVTCLKVTFTKSQQWWLIIKEIAVFVSKAH
ncbi:alpha-1,3-mannosyl-glycoprotein 4-beta-N-acetylglucosaminyltransferase C-like isoform X1 [Mytilus edulis]|uniref:alpha-1,3-mannosyl-glycoprotein 4-beta-N-acetylglucosaminyltransferase C-like isoform X1 n=2 Tax=Mytilus edulis TaxID=6550 RepID=UPI0039F04F96